MEQRSPATTAAPPDQPHLRALTARELVTELAQKASLLARKEVELAKTEVREQLRAEVKMASGLGVAGVCALVTINMLLVALVFGLSEAGILRGWLAALIVAAVVLAIGTVAGLIGWSKRVRKPLPATRRSVQENVRWARERVA
jgi:Putative Actinobacterial Holin-X, holin superfamily III